MPGPSYLTWPMLWNTVLIPSALVVALGAGCSEANGSPAEPGDPPPEAVEVPSIEEAWSTDLGELRRAATDLGARAAEHAGSVEGVAAARDGARLARVLALRDAHVDWIGRARAWLTEASRRASIDGACEAAMELARLEARDAGDLRAAYLVVFRTSLRFEGDACAVDASSMMQHLDAWRPTEGELVAIRSEPNRGDPGAEVEDAADDPGSLDAVIAQWVAGRTGTEGDATLDALTVYGRGSEEVSAASVRAVLRFDRIVAYEHGEAAADDTHPRRTWLELASTRLGAGVSESLVVGEGGLVQVQVASREGSTRVTFQLDEDARFRPFVLLDPYRIVVDFEHGGPRAEGPVRVVVLDPGHGGDDFGARAFDLRESDLTLDITRRVRTLLAQRLPDVRVVLTREDDTLVTLEERAALANGLNADLFLSIHLNAADERVQRGGVTTFVLDTSEDTQAVRLAARENGTTESEVDSLSRFLASLHREDQLRESRAFADQVHRATLRAARRTLPGLHDRGVKSAVFYVLVGATMPAVLLEASFLSREEEANALRTPSYRQGLADGIAAGIVRWVGE